jgi:hypothetical protein
VAKSHKRPQNAINFTETLQTAALSTSPMPYTMAKRKKVTISSKEMVLSSEEEALLEHNLNWIGFNFKQSRLRFGDLSRYTLRGWLQLASYSVIVS